MDFYSQVDTQAQNELSNYDKLMSLALGSAQDKKNEAKDEAMTKALIAEGFRPIVTPDKQIQFIPKKALPTDIIKPSQKLSASMSGELLQSTYPFLQYAEKNFIPVMEHLIQGVQNGDYSIQHFQEQTMALIKGGIEEAIKATGGVKAQGKGKLADSTTPEETMSIIMSEKQAYKDLIKQSQYAKNGYVSVGGE